MKLYTKEDFLKAAEFCEVSMIDTRYIISRIDEVTDPIELPSDEEIGKEFKHSSENWEVRQALEVGAKWMRDKIQEDNDKQ